MNKTKTKHIFSRKIVLKSVCSVLISICMICNTISNFMVFGANDTSDDFKQDFNESLGTSTDSIYFNPSISDAERITLDDGNGVLKIPSYSALASAGALGLRVSVDELNYVLSFDFFAKQTDTKFMFQARDTGGKAFLVFTVGANGKAGFAKNGGWVESNPNSDFFATDYIENEWNHVDVLVDISTQELTYFINGVSLGSKKPTGNISTALLSYISFFTGVGDASSELYFDNFEINYIGNSNFNSTIFSEENTVKLNFSETVDMASANKELVKSVKLYNTQNGEEVNIENVSVDSRNLMIDAMLEDSVQYALIFPEGIKSIVGNTLEERYVSFVYRTYTEAYVDKVVMVDFSGDEYLPFSEIPITQDYIKIVTICDEIDISSANISLSDEDGDVCLLGNFIISEDGIKVPISEFLNPAKKYVLTLENIVADSVTIPTYKVKFVTTDEEIKDGFSQVDMVYSDGSLVDSITEFDEIFVSTKYVNVAHSVNNVAIVLAAYSVVSETDSQTSLETNKLKLLDFEIKFIDMTSRLVAIGPDEIEVSIIVPTGADVLKCFIWNTDNLNAPLISSVIKPDYVAEVVTGVEGAKQTKDNEITAITDGFETESEIAVSLVRKDDSFDENAIYIDQILSDVNGKAGLRIAIDDISSGDYILAMTDEKNNEKKLDIAFVNKNEYIETVSYINTAVSHNTNESEAITNINDILKESYHKLGISSELYEKVDLSQTSTLLYNEIKHTPLSDVRENGSTLVKKIFLISAVGNAKIDNLFNYEEIELENDVNYEWYCKNYVSENVQKAITLRQKGNYETLGQFYAKLEESFILAVVKSPDGVGNLREVLQNPQFASKIGIPLNGKESTYIKLAGKDFLSLSELKTEFENLEKSSSKPSGSGGGGGGGGGSKGSPTKNVTVIEESEIDTTPTTILFDIFDDLENYEWAKQAIVYLAEHKIVSGKDSTSFFPGDMITREEMTAMIVRAFVKDEIDADVFFKDINNDAWYYDYLKKALGAGIIQGYSDGRFGLAEYVTRQDMVVMLNRAMKYSEIAFDIHFDGNLFVDDSSISDYAKDSVYEFKQAGIVNGVTADRFAPLENATRAEAAKIIFALLNI